ncbi:MAG: hypothetical protein NVS3B3_24510 [Aquirhabdus sp.]
MKKLIVVSTAIAFVLSAGAANACPKGTHLEGGKGPNHKGGTCVAAMKAASPMSMKKDAMPSKMDAMPMKKDTMPSKMDAMPSKNDAMPMKMA